MYWTFAVSRIFHSFCPLTKDIVYIFCSSFSSITWYSYWQLSCINIYFARVGDDRIQTCEKPKSLAQKKILMDTNGISITFDPKTFLAKRHDFLPVTAGVPSVQILPNLNQSSLTCLWFVCVVLLIFFFLHYLPHFQQFFSAL